ncbi:hypothetical protein [Rothia kristinae]|uniref:hypothetical protein n=1 Tax=Rothia kristinae TaxID=37923 RepID=UPI00244A22AF|nr:hypothetical protein [Rothia kristinae]WGH08570.1 hypothetical protein OU799_06155 [Rothia kristinae]
MSASLFIVFTAKNGWGYYSGIRPSVWSQLLINVFFASLTVIVAANTLMISLGEIKDTRLKEGKNKFWQMIDKGIEYTREGTVDAIVISVESFMLAIQIYPIKNLTDAELRYAFFASTKIKSLIDAYRSDMDNLMELKSYSDYETDSDDHIYMTLRKYTNALEVFAKIQLDISNEVNGRKLNDY